MVVPIVLIRTAKLEQMVALQHGEVVTKHLIVPIPETPADLLIVNVERAEILGCRLAAIQFQRAAEPSDLWRGSVSRPGPPVAQEAVVKVVGRVVGDVGGQTRNKVPVLNGIARCGGRNAQLMAREKAANVDLGRPGNLDS